MAKNPLFSTYRQGENRVTSSMLAVFERIDLSLLEEILAAAAGEASLEMVSFTNQPPASDRSPTLASPPVRLLVRDQDRPQHAQLASAQRASGQPGRRGRRAAVRHHPRRRAAQRHRRTWRPSGRMVQLPVAARRHRRRRQRSNRHRVGAGPVPAAGAASAADRG